MAFTGMNYLAVLVAAVAAFAFGAVWYGVLGKPWMAALGKTKDQLGSPAVPMVFAGLCQLVMAWLLAGVIGHLGEVEVAPALLTAAFVWLGFVATTLTVNHRFQGQPWSLTVIDGGHWLGVMLVQALVIGLFGV